MILARTTTSTNSTPRYAAQRGRLGRVLGACVALGCVAPFAAGQSMMDEPPRQWAGLEIKDMLGSKLPMDLEFVDSVNAPVKVGDLFTKKRPVLMFMIYHRCPLLCPTTQEYVIGVLEKVDFTVGKDFDVAVVSFDPRDSVPDAERAKARAILQYDRETDESIRAGFHFWLGKAQNSRKLADALGFPYRYLPDSGEYSHGTAIYLITPEGYISRCYPKLSFESKDIRLGLVEASEGKIGTLLDRITLWCYHPDELGNYIVSPMRVMQLGAGGCGVIVVSLVGGLWMWERKKRRRKRAVEGAAATGPGDPGVEPPSPPPPSRSGAASERLRPV